MLKEKKITKESVAIILALITGISGVTTALINRMNPQEPAARATYEVTKRSYDNLVSDFDELQEQVDFMERRLLRQCIRRIRANTTMSEPTSADTEIPRTRTRRRSKMPSYNSAQQVTP